ANDSIEITKKIQKISINSIGALALLKCKISKEYSYEICQAESALSVEANKIIAVMENSLTPHASN
ncbi:reticulate body protein Rbp-7, partial [Chlamydia sp. 17-3921]|uniref:reticulate body protein Rbp-7 n=1 Tax=Chlamydia sp. 17-3921 TaxID=2675798 RepID=UPI00191B84E5